MGLRFKIALRHGNRRVRIEPGDQHEVSWHWGVTNWSRGSNWLFVIGEWYEIRIRGGYTGIIVDPQVEVQLIDFYHPRKNNTSICKGK